MYRSHCAGELENPEFDAIKQPEHVKSVWSVMMGNFDSIWDSMVKRCSGTDSFTALKDKYKVTVKEGNSADTTRNHFISAIKEFQAESHPYIDIFDINKLQEIQDFDSGSFKTILRRDCPVIRNGINSRRDAMKEWQLKFVGTSSQDLLDTFVNLVDFGIDYNEKYNDTKYSKMTDYSEFNVEDFDEIAELRIDGVIGSGIKSSILYYLFPRVFPQLNRLTMYGMYFLSRTQNFNLKSSEFLMIGDEYKSYDHGIKMDHNYWYPYGLVMLYTLGIYRNIKNKLAMLNIPTDDHYRYVYVNTFFEELWSINKEYISTMMCTDEGN